MAELVDAHPKEQVDIWLAMARRDGEPWEHTAKICETIFRSVLLAASMWCGNREAGETLANSTAWEFMPRHVRGPKPKPEPEDDQGGVDSTTRFMKHAAGITGNG